MNASCSLHHFCDSHSAQILLCTEGRPYVRDLTDNDNEQLKTFYSQYIKSDVSQDRAACKSCVLSTDGVIISTVDPLNHMLYISSPSTPNRELFKNIRHACVRSLNVEKSPENDYPILFGDDEIGYCLSLAFPCKDFHARGGQRLYSICYLSQDKYHLLSLMNLISNCMRQAVYWLQYDANKTYENEGRIKINTKLGEPGAGTYIFRTPPRMPSDRMLSDIIHDPKLIYRIHALFVWILRTTNSGITESLFDALPTEEHTIQQERQDVLDTELVKNDRADTIIEGISTNHSDNSYDDDDDYDDYDSLEYHFSSYGYDALKLFRQFIQKLNNIKHLEYILYNWIIGNQLIIKYTNRIENKDYIRAFASVFRLFLPDGCCHLIETTKEIASCTANLILFNTDLIETTNELEEHSENNSIIIRIILDSIDGHVQEATLETLPSLKSVTIVPTYIRTIIEVLNDNCLDDEAFEAMIIQQKIKYLNKAKLYFQLGRCQVVSTLSMSVRQQMDLLHINNTTDLLIIRFWQKGLSQTYKSQIRMLKQDDNQQRKIQKKSK